MPGAPFNARSCELQRKKEKLRPADNPQIAVVVLLVQGGVSFNAAPIAREIIGDYLRVDTTTQALDFSTKMN